MHAAIKRGELDRLIHSNLKKCKIIMLLVVEVVAFCGGAISQVNSNLKRQKEKNII
jgi:abortive infection bacteriophage resistance protein